MEISKRIFLTAAFTTFASHSLSPETPAADNENAQKCRQTPAIQSMVLMPQPPKFTVRQISVTRKNYHSICRGYVLGVFYPSTNEIFLNNFVTDCKSPVIKEFCDENRDRLTMVKRHELEHARKIGLTKYTYCALPWVRAQIIAMDEVQARASEIIAAMDYRFETGRVYPVKEDFIRNARREIRTIQANIKAQNTPTDFNNTKIADIVMKYAMQSFVSNAKFYKDKIISSLMDNCAEPNLQNYPTPNIELFHPAIGLWAPLFEYDTAAGVANIWDNASDNTKRQAIQKIDSIIYEFAGKNAQKSKNTKIR